MDNKPLEENKLKVLWVNRQGLNDFYKRNDDFRNLRMENYNIYFLQCTHFNECWYNYNRDLKLSLILSDQIQEDGNSLKLQFRK